MSDNFEKHKAALDDLYRQTKEELWTPPFATLVLVMFGIPFITIFFNVAVFSFGHWLVALIVYLAEAAAPLFILYRHRQEIRETVRKKALAMDAANPGIYEASKEYLGI